MFIKLLNSVLSAIAPTHAKPDYEAFAKSRANDADTTNNQVQNRASSRSVQQTNSQPPATVDAVFYDYLLGKCPDNQVEDKLSAFVVEKIIELIHTPEHILAEMPAMPASVNQLMLALNNQDFDLTAILKQVEKEPVIAAMLIKQANSAKYKRGVKPVSDIKTAFINLGMVGVKEGEVAYFVALLDQVGKMIVFRLMVDAFKVVDPNSPPNSTALKSLMHSKSHLLTYACAEFWQLPDEVIREFPDNKQQFVSPYSISACVAQAIHISMVIKLVECQFIEARQGLIYAKERLICDEAETLLVKEISPLIEGAQA